MDSFEAYKMDGLGNDFIIFDKRKKSISLTKDQIIKISDRKNIGCDQVILIDKDKSNNILLEFYNSDGSEISACGNGSRCVAYFLMKENNSKTITLKTKAGILYAELNSNNLVTINMGQPKFEWDQIPLIKKMDNKNLKVNINQVNGKEIIGGFAVNIGNPHIVFFTKDLKLFNLNEIGPKLEKHNYFPEKCNVTLANRKDKKNIKIKVWERGAGLTRACGTAACAAAVSAAVLKLSDRCVDIEFSEGSLNIEWKKNDNIYMTGKVSEIKKIFVNIDL
jgi:diaminopimelate epimerase